MTTTYTGPNSGVITFACFDLKTRIQSLLKWDSDKEQVTVEDGKIWFDKGKRMLPTHVVRELGLKQGSVLKTFGTYYYYTI